MQPKVEPSQVHLLDGSSKQKKYLLFWHINVRHKKVGRGWLSRPATDEHSCDAYITVEISEPWRGRGVGTEAFRLICEHSGLDIIAAEARKSNIGSHRAMINAGFVQISDTAAGEARFRWTRMSIKRFVPFDLSVQSQLERPFPDHDCELQADFASLTLKSCHGCRQDPNVRLIAENDWGIKPSQISSFNRIRHTRGRTWGFSMVHSWALVTASLHYWKTGALPDCCIHIDDHTDLGPFFGTLDQKGISEAAGIPLMLKYPTNVREHLYRGTFNKGSFLTPWATTPKEKTLIHLGWNGLPVTFDGVPETNLGRVMIAPTRQVESRGILHYHKGGDLSSLSTGGDIWLDIDLDAFCNRFDGDSDRCQETGTNEEFSTANRRLNEGLFLLEHAQALARVKLVTVAASPGFCPSEYWKPMLKKIGNVLNAPTDIFS